MEKRMAVLMCESGLVGLCKTAAKNGQTVSVCYLTSNGGTPVHAMDAKVSRNKRIMTDEALAELPCVMVCRRGTSVQI